MYTYGRFTSLYGRNQHNTVNPLIKNKFVKMTKKVCNNESANFGLLLSFIEPIFFPVLIIAVLL